MPEKATRAGARLMDQPEYKTKAKPLTGRPDDTVSEAVKAMYAKNYGSIVVTEADERMIGIVTERDIMNKVVGRNLDPDKTTLREIMTTEIRMAREEDQLLDWLRIMSNERFRRLPVVDDDGRITAIFTQGDFVSYTWPDLLSQLGNLTRATVMDKFHYLLIGGGILIYALAMIVVVSVV